MKSLHNLLLAVLAFCALVSPAEAAGVKGQLTGVPAQNVKLLGINKDSRAKVYPLTAKGKFSIAARKGMTLHLIESSGRYFGPLVGSSGKKAYAPLSGKSADLGKIRISASKFGSVKITDKIAKAFVTRRALSFNARTGPKGAGNFGFVKMAAANSISARASETVELGEDLDADGLPEILDIDDDGDGKLDVVDPVQHKSAEFAADSTSTLRLSLTEPLNANVASLDSATIEQRIKDHLILAFWIRNNGQTAITAVNVDCSNLSYCRTPGGSATLRMDNGPLPEGAPWNNYDPDGDTLPNLKLEADALRGAASVNFRPHASRSDLRPGDTVIFKLNTSAGNFDLPGMLPFFFTSSPTLKEYYDGTSTHAVNYPVAPDSPGTTGSPIQLTGDTVGFTFWKPQRLPIEGAETAPYIDMGGLYYGISIGLSSGVYTCLPAEYTINSAGLTLRTGARGTEILLDGAADLPADPANTLSYSLNLGGCLRRQGVEPSGVTALLALTASSDRGDQTSQWVSVKLP